MTEIRSAQKAKRFAQNAIVERCPVDIKSTLDKCLQRGSTASSEFWIAAGHLGEKVRMTLRYFFQAVRLEVLKCWFPY
ncbi:MAG: hypothetical protein ACP5I8_06670 [Phycisphaerae bacterium]